MRLVRFLLFCGVVGFSLTGSLWAAEEGFVPLFDGTSLKGWFFNAKKADAKGYTAENGILACRQGCGGDLLTEKEYADFILRFEFKLEPGTNNGLGIRAPKEPSDVAYQGIELQIIDESSEKYRNLQPWQVHGSYYNVFPAKPGYLKPVGEWNQEEVVVRGTKVKVILNGTTILDVDSSTVTDPEVIKKHPGMKRRTGHIGFLGHDDPIEFRNIRIKEL